MTAPSLAERPVQIARYESLIRLAEAIRSHRDQKELFHLLADELREVVPFDAMAQYDESAAKVNWRLCELCTQPNPAPLSAVATEETVAWWVNQHQKALVIPLVEEETRFPSTMARLKESGLRSLCAFPLSTAHAR